MSGSGPRPRRAPRERLAAWLVTGPPGHLWSVVADVALLWARYAVARARGRRPRARGSSARVRRESS